MSFVYACMLYLPVSETLSSEFDPLFVQLSFASPFQPAQTSGAFSFNNLGQTQSGRRSFI